MALSEAMRRAVEAGLAEDGRDVTSEAVVPEPMSGRGVLFVKASGVICGLEALTHAMGASVEVSLLRADGDEVSAGDEVARLSGPLRTLLRGERVALNLIGRLSGIATLARAFAEQAGEAAVTDTRKTTPGLRELEKYAVRCGGASNHRLGLFDAVLIKDNHIAAVGSVGEAVRRAKSAGLRVEVEVEDDAGLREALDAGAESVLLDNFTVDAMREAVRTVRSLRPDVLVEASGGVTLARVADIAATGVDRISVGALTHSAPALDVSLELEVV